MHLGKKTLAAGILTAVCIVAAAPVSAGEKVGVDTIVDIRPVQGSPRIDFSYDREYLKKLERKADERHSVEGLTISKFVGEMKVRFDIMKYLTQACIRKVAIEADVGYHRPLVLIAKENKKGSCMRNETLAHERRHVDVYQTVSYRAFVRANEVLNRTAQELIGKCGPDSEKIQDVAMRALQGAMEGVAAEAKMENDILQDAIDTPEEYERLGKVCN